MSSQSRGVRSLHVTHPIACNPHRPGLMPRPSARAILAAVVLPIGLLFGIHGSASIAQTVAPGTDTPIVAPANAPATQPAPDNTQAAGSPASAEFDLGQRPSPIIRPVPLFHTLKR